MSDPTHDQRPALLRMIGCDTENRVVVGCRTVAHPTGSVGWPTPVSPDDTIGLRIRTPSAARPDPGRSGRWPSFGFCFFFKTRVLFFFTFFYFFVCASVEVAKCRTPDHDTTPDGRPTDPPRTPEDSAPTRSHTNDNRPPSPDPHITYPIDGSRSSTISGHRRCISDRRQPIVNRLRTQTMHIRSTAANRRPSPDPTYYLSDRRQPIVDRLRIPHTTYPIDGSQSSTVSGRTNQIPVRAVAAERQPSPDTGGARAGHTTQSPDEMRNTQQNTL
jgi:hypothetical protein